MGIRLTAASLLARATRRDLRVAQSLPAADLVPAELPLRVAVLVDGAAGPGWIAFACPCGTGHQAMVNLATSRRPRWTLTGPYRAPTLTPSLDLVDGQHRCHFWIRAGRVSWAEPPRTTSPSTSMENR